MKLKHLRQLPLMLGLALTLCGSAMAQTPSQYVSSLSLLAPHRPVMERNTTGMDVFHGGLVEYKHEDNHEALEAWIDAYPAEAQAYRMSVKSYISDHTNTTLTGTEADIFADLKAQWVMACHIFDEEVYAQ